MLSQKIKTLMKVCLKCKIKNYLIDNREFFQEEYHKMYDPTSVNHLTDAYKIFGFDIHACAQDGIKSFIIENVTKSLACDPESVIILLEDIDLEKYVG